MLYIALSVDEMILSFFFFPGFDILVDGYNSLDRNSVRYYLLFRARDTSWRKSSLRASMGQSLAYLSLVGSGGVATATA